MIVHLVRIPESQNGNTVAKNFGKRKPASNVDAGYSVFGLSKELRLALFVVA